MESYNCLMKNEQGNKVTVLCKELIGVPSYLDIVRSIAQTRGIHKFWLQDFHKYQEIYRNMLIEMEEMIRDQNIQVEITGENTARKDILFGLISDYPVVKEIEGVLTQGSLEAFFRSLGYQCVNKEDTIYQEQESENLFLQPGNMVGEYLSWLQDYIHSGYLIDEFSRVYQLENKSICENDSRPFLSIVISPLMKYKEAVAEMFQALCAQECQDFEVLIVKNQLGKNESQSLACILEELPEYMRKKIQEFNLDSSCKGVPLNYGFTKAAGEYVIVINECDLPFPNWVAEFKKMNEEKRGAILHSFVASQRWTTTENEKGEYLLNASGSITTEFCVKFHYLKQLNMNFCPMMGLAFPTYAFQMYSIRFNEALSNIEDWDFLMKMSAICGVVDIPIMTCLFRSWENIDTISTPAERKQLEIDYQSIQDELKQRPLLLPSKYQSTIMKVLENQGDIFDPQKAEEAIGLHVHSGQRYTESISLHSDDDNGKVMIRVNDVAIRFNLSTERLDSVKEYMIKTIKRQVVRDEFWALKGVSFEIKKGDSLGLIGLNGSGKSTMLKTIAGVLKPTKGSVEVFGKVAPLIELGAGFDMDLTARENVYLNGALLGYSREVMDGHYDDIVEFSELADFMNVPVKNFSSGMVSRLAFAIATIGTPDILIVDEVLSVGDFRFQEKCVKRIRKMMKKDTTILFVSHSIDQVVSLCNKIVWLEKGVVKMFGDARKICEVYSKSK